MERFGPEDFGAQFVRLDQFGGAWIQRWGAVNNLGKQKNTYQLLQVYAGAFTGGRPCACIMKNYDEKYVSACKGTKCVALGSMTGEILLKFDINLESHNVEESW